MLVNVIHNDKSIKQADLNDAKARAVSQEATVAAVMTVAETPSGYHFVYIDGACRQYNPIECSLV